MSHGIRLLLFLVLHFPVLKAAEVDADFTGGSIGNFTFQKNHQQLHFEAADRDAKATPYWYFRLTGLVKGQDYLFQTTALTDEPSAFIAISEDQGRQWHMKEAVQVAGKLNVSLQATQEKILIASVSPLPAEKLIQELTNLAKHRNGVEWITQSTVASADDAGSMNYPILRICEGDKVEARRFGIWIQSNPQNWTQQSNWVLIGLAEWLFSADSQAVWLRQNAEVYLYVAENDSVPHELTYLISDNRLHATLLLNCAAASEKTTTLSLDPANDLEPRQLQQSFAAILPVHLKELGNHEAKHLSITLASPSFIREASPENQKRLGSRLAEFLGQQMESAKQSWLTPD